MEAVSGSKHQLQAFIYRASWRKAKLHVEPGYRIINEMTIYIHLQIRPVFWGKRLGPWSNVD